MYNKTNEQTRIAFTKEELHKLFLISETIETTTEEIHNCYAIMDMLNCASLYLAHNEFSVSAANVESISSIMRNKLNDVISAMQSLYDECRSIYKSKQVLLNGDIFNE